MIAALTINIGSPTGIEATVGVAWQREDGDRQQYRYWIRLVGGGELTAGHDLHSGCGDQVSHLQMMLTLLAFLSADAETYAAYEMRGLGGNPPDDYLFGKSVAKWAYGVSDELAQAREELDTSTS